MSALQQMPDPKVQLAPMRPPAAVTRDTVLPSISQHLPAAAIRTPPRYNNNARAVRVSSVPKARGKLTVVSSSSQVGQRGTKEPGLHFLELIERIQTRPDRQFHVRDVEIAA